MQLALLRHGVAEDAGPSTAWADAPRRLTDEGRRRMRAAARGMKRLGLNFDAVVTSPLTRCLQTAEIICEVVGGTPKQDTRLEPGMDADTLVFLLMEHPIDASVLICGHQPDLSNVTADLVSGGAVEFKKGGLAVIDLEIPRLGAGVLRALYPPAALRALAK
jgi:phosphohistidine phosphatase